MALCQEFVDIMRSTKAKKGAVIIKVGLEKAYDHMEWGFLAQTLEDAGVLGKLSSIIMQLNSKGSCCLLWKGDATDLIKHSKGLC